MKFRIGDKVLIESIIKSIEITKEGVIYCVIAHDKIGRFTEDVMILDVRPPISTGAPARADREGDKL